MQITINKLSDTKLELTVVADQALLDDVKKGVLEVFQKTAKIAGFREGKAPLAMVEKSVDQSQLQTEFLEQAVNRMFAQAVTEKNLRPAEQPEINISKFVPFTTLEFVATFEAVGEVKLPDYKNFKLVKKPATISAKDIDEVIENLRTRGAERIEVDRAAKDGDEVVLDFAGRDAETDAPIAGADAKDYPLVLGSKSFIPGFEEELIGLKPNDDKEFTITFPADYGSVSLQSKKVIFKVTIKKVHEVKLPKVDDEFAAKIGPFKTVAELKADVKKQLATERQGQADRDYENDLIQKLAEKTKVALPKSMVDEEIDRLDQEEKQNLAYQGQTWQEHLKAEGLSEEQHHEQKRPAAENRVKAGLMLSEIAEQEKLDVTREELDLRMQMLKAQYPDQQMQAELAKPTAKREIASRILTEKTIAQLATYASK